MYFNEHNPAHFHAIYGDYVALVEIENSIIKGKMPKKQRKMLSKWCELHKDELLNNWKSVRETGKIFKIEPLE